MIPMVKSSLRRRSGVRNARTNALSTCPPEPRERRSYDRPIPAVQPAKRRRHRGTLTDADEQTGTGPVGSYDPTGPDLRSVLRDASAGGDDRVLRGRRVGVDRDGDLD